MSQISPILYALLFFHWQFSFTTFVRLYLCGKPCPDNKSLHYFYNSHYSITYLCFINQTLLYFAQFRVILSFIFFCIICLRGNFPPLNYIQPSVHLSSIHPLYFLFYCTNLGYKFFYDIYALYKIKLNDIQMQNISNHRISNFGSFKWKFQ